MRSDGYHPTTSHVYSPTGVASTVSLLSDFLHHQVETLSIDVGDAHLMVEQDAPTVFEKLNELRFTLPDYGLDQAHGSISDDGLLARRKESNALYLPRDFHKLVEFLKSKGKQTENQGLRTSG